MVSLYIELALAEINRLANLYQWLSLRHHMTIFGNSLSMPCKNWEYLIIIYIQLIFRYINDDTWQVITIPANIAVKTDIHIQLAPAT